MLAKMSPLEGGQYIADTLEKVYFGRYLGWCVAWFNRIRRHFEEIRKFENQQVSRELIF